MGKIESALQGSNRLGRCEVCDFSNAKYTCPRCEVKSCSLTCTNIHKRELNCNGIRDVTFFKRIDKFTNSDLLKDYHFLENMIQSASKYRKDLRKQFTRIDKPLPVQLKKLQSAVMARESKIFFLPPLFEKHKRNTTFYNWKNKQLYWRIEWNFIIGSDCVEYVDERVLDSDRLGAVVGKYFEVKNDADKRMEPFYSAGCNNVVLLMKAENERFLSNRYYELDLDESIRENLKRKTVYEFPCISVVLRIHQDAFHIILQDDEMENIGSEVIDLSEDKKIVHSDC